MAVTPVNGCVGDDLVVKGFDVVAVTGCGGSCWCGDGGGLWSRARRALTRFVVFPDGGCGRRMAALSGCRLLQGGCDLENETVLTVLANVTRRVGSLGAGCDGVEGLESVGVRENPAGSLSGSVWAWV